MASYLKSKTQQYDEEATSHLMYVLLTGGVCIYVKGCGEMETETALRNGRPHTHNLPSRQPSTPHTNRFVVVPLMAGYALYSLLHERHKSWYSWAVTSLTGFVYVFGFVMMTPQVG